MRSGLLALLVLLLTATPAAARLTCTDVRVPGTPKVDRVAFDGIRAELSDRGRLFSTATEGIGPDAAFLRVVVTAGAARVAQVEFDAGERFGRSTDTTPNYLFGIRRLNASAPQTLRATVVSKSGARATLTASFRVTPCPGALVLGGAAPDAVVLDVNAGPAMAAVFVRSPQLGAVPRRSRLGTLRLSGPDQRPLTLRRPSADGFGVLARRGSVSVSFDRTARGPRIAVRGLPPGTEAVRLAFAGPDGLLRIGPRCPDARFAVSIEGRSGATRAVPEEVVPARTLRSSRLCR